MNNKFGYWFIFGVALLFGFIFIYEFGFGQIVTKYAQFPERLKDNTFPTWDAHSFMSHGFLTFLSKESFELKEAYTNHSPFYLIWNYFLYKVEIWFPILPMRMTSACISMFASLGVITFVLYRKWGAAFRSKLFFLLLLGLLYFLTMPTYWISAGKFNVDNPFHFYWPLVVLVGYQVSENRPQKFSFWLSILLLCIVAPKGAIIVGLVLVVQAFSRQYGHRYLLGAASALVVFGLCLSALPMVVGKLLGFTSKNSGWLFRSGLDGDTRYFSNIFNAVLSPVDPRPSYFLIVPLGLLLLQIIIKWRVPVVSEVKDQTGLSGLFWSVVLSPYLVTLLLWPQSISVHPYLYDYLLLGPIVLLIITNFLSYRNVSGSPGLFSFWLWLMALAIMFNLTQLAQAAHCASCSYPSWLY